MAHAVTSTPGAAEQAERSKSADVMASIPWELWCGAIAMTSCSLGLEWDFSWHQSIGRDTFWNPAHMMIYLCGVLTGIVCGYLVLATTFGRSPVRGANAVSVFGFRAPLGCFIATWGGLAMLASAPFDNWWHEAYGLDVQLISLPHMILLSGMLMVFFGFLLLTAGALNRAALSAGEGFNALQRLFLYQGGMAIVLLMLAFSQRVDRSWLHSSPAYKTMGVMLPWLLIMLWLCSRNRWAATWTAALYSLLRIVEMLILPLFPATPKLGPVLTPITHFLPSQFPILILVPAVALDLLWHSTRQWKPLQRAIVSGAVFMGLLLAVEWPFANFLMSPAARNRFFGTMYTGFNTLPVDRLPHFSFPQTRTALWHGLLVATVAAMASSWIGLRLGEWMRRLQR